MLSRGTEKVNITTTIQDTHFVSQYMTSQEGNAGTKALCYTGRASSTSLLYQLTSLQILHSWPHFERKSWSRRLRALRPGWANKYHKYSDLPEEMSKPQTYWRILSNVGVEYLYETISEILILLKYLWEQLVDNENRPRWAPGDELFNNNNKTTLCFADEGFPCQCGKERWDRY